MCVLGTIMAALACFLCACAISCIIGWINARIAKRTSQGGRRYRHSESSLSELNATTRGHRFDRYVLDLPPTLCGPRTRRRSL